MKKLIVLLIITTITALLAIPVPPPLKAQETGSLQDFQKQLEENRSKQDEYKAKIAQLQNQATSLQKQISYMENSIYLTQLEIEETQTQIEAKKADLTQLNTDIDKLNQRIERLASSLEYQTEIYKKRARESYKAARLTPIELLLASDSLGELITQIKYLNVFESQDKQLLDQMRDTRQAYDTQKTLLEEKKEEVERIKAEIEYQKATLEEQKASLQSQKVAKEDLLTITKNDEATYRKLLSEIKAEQRAIEQAIAQFTAQLIAKGVPEGTEVKRGDIIGIQGSTGLSTGDHVHFGVYTRCGESWCHTNPREYIESGELDWPLDEFEISQEYGQTEFAKSSGFYANSFHNGIDMYGPAGSAVKAGADGKVTYSIDSYGGKGAIVYHNEELMTLYWHLK